MAKMGRPTDAPKTHRVDVRLSEEDKKMLDYCIARTGMSAPEVARKGINNLYRQLKKNEDSS